MTSLLDRRVAKLEAAARPASDEGRVRLVLVRVGQSADEEVAKLSDRRPDDHLMVVQFVRATDAQSSGRLQ